MTRRRLTSLPPLLSSSRRSRRSIYDEDLDDVFSTTLTNYNDREDDISESDNEPVRRPSRNGMGKQPSKDSFTSTLGQRVAVTQLTPKSGQALHPERQAVYIVSGKEDQPEPVLLPY
jgi:hypothetical protein